jgi:CRISPR/Cas system CSM-associated protein Csm3 (group 7 of RAMP superfamily)
MSNYDFFATVEHKDALAIDQALTQGQIDLYSHMLLLHTFDCRKQTSVARAAHKMAVHQKDRSKMFSRYSRNLITDAGSAHDLMGKLGLLAPRTEGLSLLPQGLPLSILSFRFTLKKQYISRDDALFYPIDNPVRKERVFKVPMVSPASWKGILRSNAVDLLVLCGKGCDEFIRERLHLIDIFGDEKAELEMEQEAKRDSLAEYLDEFMKNHFGEQSVQLFRQAESARFNATQENLKTRRKGRLRCLPSYFDGIELDVLNPRSRKTRAGTLPIFMEVVPAGCSALFGLIYLPFDLLGHSDAEIWNEAKHDWALIGPALSRMFRTGFGAKRSNGCGRACEKIQGNLSFHDLPPHILTDLEGLETLATCFEVSS